MESLKDLVRPPFANYDVVVYFGAGLFFVPFLNRYLMQPAGLTWPRFEISTSSAIAAEVVSGLSLLFSIYIMGHILAYTSSQFVEKLADRILGKISTAILLSSMAKPRERNEVIRSLIYDRWKSIAKDRARFSTLIRAIAHLPVSLAYVFIFFVGIFGYYNTRVPYSVIEAARAKLATIGVGQLSLNIRTPWFKPLEYYVINRIPSATPRMYNYLVIGGLFRSLCIVFLAALWAQLYHIGHYLSDGHWYIQPMMGNKGPHAAMMEYSLVSVCYVFCLFSYLKFQRRYAEEAIFAFVFEPRGAVQAS